MSKIFIAFLFTFAALLIGSRIFVWNLSKSLPLGLYLRLPTQPVVGGLVVFCLTESVATLAAARGYVGPGYCPHGEGPVLKRVVAMRGLISITPQGVWVDDVLLPRSKHLDEDSKGRPMPRPQREQYRLEGRQAWVMGDTTNSFDSRYYGPVPTDRLQTIVPVWIY